MVLLGVGSSGPLPPVQGTTPRTMSAPHTKAAKSLAPRIAELAKKLGKSEGSSKGAACELALLASRSISACVAVAEAKIEAPLAKVLTSSKDPTTQCWTLSILSNLASMRASRERQVAAVPALTALIRSPNAEVQHAAALHLATLSHSSAVQQAFGANANALRMLHDIEGKMSDPLCAPGKAALKQEAAQYARWALRTAQGRNYKPHYTPKSRDQLEFEGATAVQARVRSSFVANQYRKEMQARKAAAVVLQAGYRSHKSRADVAAELLIQAPAVALLQGWIRGRAYRKEVAAAKARERRHQDNAAARVQARYRGQQVRSRPLPSKPGASGADGPELVLANVACLDGTLVVPLAPTKGAPAAPMECIAAADERVVTLMLKLAGSGPVDFYAVDLSY
jgi:hypothetical protein